MFCAQLRPKNRTQIIQQSYTLFPTINYGWTVESVYLNNMNKLTGICVFSLLFVFGCVSDLFCFKSVWLETMEEKLFGIPPVSDLLNVDFYIHPNDSSISHKGRS